MSTPLFPSVVSCVFFWIDIEDRETHTDVPSLRDEYSEEEDHKETSCSHPSVWNERRRFVQPCLVLLFHIISILP